VKEILGKSVHKRLSKWLLIESRSCIDDSGKLNNFISRIHPTFKVKYRSAITSNSKPTIAVKIMAKSYLAILKKLKIKFNFKKNRKK
jgi:hypothetical protein